MPSRGLWTYLAGNRELSKVSEQGSDRQSHNPCIDIRVAPKENLEMFKK